MRFILVEVCGAVGTCRYNVTRSVASRHTIAAQATDQTCRASEGRSRPAAARGCLSIESADCKLVQTSAKGLRGLSIHSETENVF